MEPLSTGREKHRRYPPSDSLPPIKATIPQLIVHCLYTLLRKVLHHHFEIIIPLNFDGYKPLNSDSKFNG